MNERENKIQRQRFSFLCPTNKTVEARILLSQINKVRLVPPRQGIQDVRVTPWGIQEGVNIRGVASSEETFIEVLHALADAGIAGYSRETQILEVPKIKDKRSSETSTQYEGEKLTVEHRWGKKEKAQEEDLLYKMTFISLLGSPPNPTLTMFFKENRFQFFKILNKLQKEREQSENNLEKRVVLDWTISQLEEIIDQDKNGRR